MMATETQKLAEMQHGAFVGPVYTSGCALQANVGAGFFGPFDFNDKVVLDCGCGSGLSLMNILKNSRPKKVFAFDASESQIATAKEMDSKNEIDWFVGTFDNFLELRPELKGQVDIVISNAALQFAPDLKKFFNTAALTLKPKGHLWALWPVFALLGPVLQRVQMDERFSGFTKDIAIDERHHNGVKVPGQHSHHRLKHAFEGLEMFDREYVAKVWMTINHGTREANKKFIAGINPARCLIPDELKAEFDEFCLEEVLKTHHFEGDTIMHGPVILVRAELKGDHSQIKHQKARG